MTEGTLSLGLGSGSNRNPLISIRQAASATTHLALGFAPLAISYSRTKDFKDDLDWSFGLALLIALSLSAISSNLNPNLSNSLKIMCSNGMNMADFNVAFCPNRMQTKLTNLILGNARVKSQHFKLKVVEIAADLFATTSPGYLLRWGFGPLC